jgi:hypothetical protein
MSNVVPQAEIWNRQPGEPNRWYARFERYRLAGPSRSLLGTLNAELTDQGKARQAKVPGAWNQAFRSWRWRERAEAWDDQERRQVREARAHDVDEMNRRHIQEAKALQNKALQRLQSLDLQDLSAADTLRFLVEATKLERTARGEPETIEERRLTGKDGGAVVLSLEEAVQADQELEEWENERLQTNSHALPKGNPQVP